MACLLSGDFTELLQEQSWCSTEHLNQPQFTSTFSLDLGSSHWGINTNGYVHKKRPYCTTE
jgi:hypothetical protein